VDLGRIARTLLKPTLTWVSDVKRGQNLQAKATFKAEGRATRPRPRLWGWGRGQN